MNWPGEYNAMRKTKGPALGDAEAGHRLKFCSEINTNAPGSVTLTSCPSCVVDIFKTIQPLNMESKLLPFD